MDKVSKNSFLDMCDRVNSYLIKNGGDISPTRKIYVDFSNKTDYVTYKQFKNMNDRFTAYTKKYGRQPNTIIISVQSNDLSNKGVKIPLSTFLDMKFRVDKVKGKISPTRKIYLDFVSQYDFVTYKEYKRMLSSYDIFVHIKGRQPNYVSTSAQGITKKVSSSSSVVSSKNCYRSKRWFSGHEIIQDTMWYCGCNLSQQILKELTNNFYSEEYLAKRIGTTRKGSSPSRIVSIIKNILTKDGFTVKRCEWVNLSSYSWDDIGKMIESEKFGIGLHSVYKMKWGHYEYPIKLCNSSQIITIAQGLSGGYIQPRSFATMKKYANAGSYPSLLIVEVE